MRRDTKPAFDPAGRYLYFLSARDFDPVPDAMHFEFSFPKGVRPYLITLRKDLRLPFQPELALLHPEEEEKKAEERQKEKASKAPAPELVEIDLEGITNRIVAFPVPDAATGEFSEHAMAHSLLRCRLRDCVPVARSTSNPNRTAAWSGTTSRSASRSILPMRSAI